MASSAEKVRRAMTPPSPPQAPHCAGSPPLNSGRWRPSGSGARARSYARLPRAKPASRPPCSESVKVVVRVRPLSGDETRKGHEECARQRGMARLLNAPFTAPFAASPRWTRSLRRCTCIIPVRRATSRRRALRLTPRSTASACEAEADALGRPPRPPRAEILSYLRPGRARSTQQGIYDSAAAPIIGAAPRRRPAVQGRTLPPTAPSDVLVPRRLRAPGLQWHNFRLRADGRRQIVHDGGRARAGGAAWHHPQLLQAHL